MVTLSSLGPFYQVFSVLDNLQWFDIPSDLSEIDANWCYNRASQYVSEEVEDSIEKLNVWDFDFMADLLRESWTEAYNDAGRN